MSYSLKFLSLIVLFALLTISCTSTVTEFIPTITPIYVTAKHEVKITEFPAVTSVNNIEIEFTRFELDNNFLTIYICYETPTKETWHPDKVSLMIGNQQINYSNLTYSRIRERSDGFLCSVISFRDVNISDLGEVELVIGQLETEISQYDCAKAQKKLDEQKMNVFVECDSTHPYEYDIEKWPENLNPSEADSLIALIDDSFSDIVTGPWIFMFDSNGYGELSSYIPAIPSVQDNWELFEEIAHTWQGDAFLDSVRIDVNQYLTFQMSMTYYSPSSHKSLVITAENSGEITIMHIDSHSSLNAILRESLAFDSQDALQIFSENEIIKSCLQSSNDPITLDLISYTRSSTTWKLDIWNCPESDNFELKSYYLDGQTGDIIEPLQSY